MVLSFYDLPNFEDSLGGILAFSCQDLFDQMNQPSTTELNLAFSRFNAELRVLASESERVSLVEHSGLMQFHFGFPNLNVPPETILPPGDPSLPSPIQAMFLGADCIHLNSNGYRYLARNLWEQFYIHQFCVTDTSLSLEFARWETRLDLSLLVDFINRRCP